ncbi:MAG: Gfo/Idh/MocA family protein [Thermoguttaceae bacterium]|jgi:predicted dehydrogenase
MSGTIKKLTGALAALSVVAMTATTAFADDEVFKLGVIGATTSHVPAFVKTVNNPDAQEIFQGFEIVGLYPGGVPDNPNSWDRVERFTRECEEAGLTIYNTIDELVANVDGILLESVDGRVHLEQAKPVIAAKKPLFIDKPMAASLRDVLDIFKLCEENDVPVFCSSALRFVKEYQEMRNDSPIGEIYGADATSPCTLNPRHPSLYWYGIHGVESLFTVLGPDCVSVSRTGTTTTDIAVGIWEGNRMGTFRGIRKGAAPYSCRVFGEKEMVNVGDYQGYEPLLVEICKFFQTGIAPVDKQETINIHAFMTAADMSRRERGKSITLEEAIEAAEQETILTVNLKMTETSQVVWNDGSEEKTVEFETLHELVENAREDYDTVRFILDNTVGVPFDTVQKVFSELADAKLANYLY